MLLFLISLALTGFFKMASEGDGDKSSLKEKTLLVLTYIFGAITIYLGISYFLFDSLQPPSPYDFHW